MAIDFCGDDSVRDLRVLYCTLFVAYVCVLQCSSALDYNVINLPVQ